MDEQRAQLERAFARFAGILSPKCTEREIQRCASVILDNVALSAIQFKHPGFKSEAEWRLIIATIFAQYIPLDKTKDLDFRASSRTVIPYFKTPKQPDGKLPIVSVMIGPTLDPNRRSTASTRS